MDKHYAIVWTRKDGITNPFMGGTLYESRERALEYCNECNAKKDEPHFGFVVEMVIAE